MVKLKSNQKHRIIDARQIGKPVKKITSGMLGTILALSIYSGADKIKIAEAEEISSSNSQTIEEDQVIAQGFYLRSSEQENGSVTKYTYTPELNTKTVNLNEGDSTSVNNFENMEYLEITITDDNCSLDFIGKMPNLKTLIIRSELDELNCLKSLPEMVKNPPLSGIVEAMYCRISTRRLFIRFFVFDFLFSCILKLLQCQR